MSFFSCDATLPNARYDSALSLPPSQVPTWISVSPEKSLSSGYCTYVVPLAPMSLTDGSTVTG